MAFYSRDYKIIQLRNVLDVVNGNTPEDSEGEDWFVAAAWCASIPGKRARALFGASVSPMFVLDKPENGRFYGTGH